MSSTTAAPESTGYDAAEEFLEHRTPAQRVQTLLHNYPWLSPAVVLVISVIVFSMLNSRFATPNNLSLITQQVAVVGALAVGQTLIILTAGIDLSCGAIMVFSSMVMAKTAFDSGVPGPLAILLGIGVGALAGAANGLLVTKVRLPPFIVTLGTPEHLRGADPALRHRPHHPRLRARAPGWPGSVRPSPSPTSGSPPASW